MPETNGIASAQKWARRHSLSDVERLWIEEAECETVAEVADCVRATKFEDWFGYPHDGSHDIKQALIEDGIID